MAGDRNHAGDRSVTGRSERGTREGKCRRYSIGEGETPSEAVTYALMDSSTDVPLERRRPLYEVVDPDALDNLFRPNEGSVNDDVVGRVTFTYGGYDVTVRADGEILLREDNVR